MKKQIAFLFYLLVFVKSSFAQPFADIVTFNYQTFTSDYKEFGTKNKTDNYFLNFFLPKEFKNGNVLLIRLNSEFIQSSMISNSTYSLAAVYMPLGFQFVTKDKKWKTMVLVIPKLASDFRDAVDRKDFQMGGIFLQNYICTDKLKLKAGLYYNREAFGNFFVPLAAVDWQVTSRINLYGIIPTNYKAEYTIVKNKLYTGLCFKSFTRSFRLSKNENQDYVRYDEMQLKLFLDGFVYKKLLLFGELGYALGKNPLQYTVDTKVLSNSNPVFTPVRNGPIFNIGVAYRMRFDLNP